MHLIALYIKSMIFGFSFTSSFFTKQQIQTVPTYNKYIHLDCFSILPTKDKITVMICRPQRLEGNNERGTKRGQKNNKGSYRFFHNNGNRFLLFQGTHVFI